MREAQDYTWHALERAYRPGMGQHLPDRLFWARDDKEEAEREGAEGEAQSESGAADSPEPTRRADARGTH